MATWLSLTNDLQERLREDETAAVSTNTYSALLSQFVNQAKREIEDAHDWSSLKTVLTVTTSASTATYTITGSNERSRVYTKNKVIYDSTNKSKLIPITAEYLHTNTYLVNSVQEAPPQYYIMSGISSGELQITFYPTPAGTYTIKLPMVVPQADFTTGSTTLTVPAWPVFLRAYALALAERGEDGGTTTGEAGTQAWLALNQAITTDTGNSTDADIIWEVA